MFNCINNSITKLSSQMKHAFTARNSHKEFLQDSLQWLETIKFTRGRLACSEGRKQCSSLLWKTLENANIKFLLTRRLNQDALENMFATIIEKGRYHTNPDARQFRAAFRQVLVDSLMLKSDGANCEDDLDSFLLSLKSLKTARVDDILTTLTTQDGTPQAVVSLTPVFGEQVEATSTKDQQIIMLHCWIHRPQCSDEVVVVPRTPQEHQPCSE